MRKFYSKLTALCMAGALAFTSFAPVGNLIGITSIEVQAETTSDTSWYQEGQTEFTISDEADLRGLADLVNGDDSVSFENCTIKLGNNIDLNNIKWTPIGKTSDKPFKGNFDGQNYSIINLYVEETISESETIVPEIYAGLFGYIEGAENSNLEIKNIILNNVEVSVKHEGGQTLSKRDKIPGVGSLAGYSKYVNISNCNINSGKLVSDVGCVGGLIGRGIGTIDNCDIKNCDVNSTLTYFGLAGVVGILGSGDAKNLTFKGKVSGFGQYVAGIVGSISNGNIDRCITQKETTIEPMTTDAITAGITASFNQRIFNCLNYADIKGIYQSGDMTVKCYGCGIAIPSKTAGQQEVKNCINYGKIEGGQVAGIVYMDIKSTGLSGFKINSCANLGEISGYTSSAAIAVNKQNNAFPFIISNCYSLGKVNKQDSTDCQVVSDSKKAGGTYTNTYYNSENGNETKNNGDIDGVQGYTIDCFKNRTIVELLNGNDESQEAVWYQNIDYPDFAFNMTLVEQITAPDTLNVAPGKTLKLQTSVTPDDATVDTLLYSSSDEKIATVSEDGTVKGIKEGKAEITVKALDSGLSKTVKVTVKEPEPEKQPSTPSTPSQPSAPATDNNTVASGITVTVGTNNYIVTSNTSVAYAGTTNTKATKISIPATVKIGAATYKVTSVSANAFKGNKKIKSVTIGSNVTSIGKAAFANCKNLTSVVIGKNVKTIGSKAFYGCSKLKKITVKSKVLKKVGSKAFKGIHKNAVIKVPSKKLKAYKKLLKGKGQKSSVNIK